MEQRLTIRMKDPAGFLVHRYQYVCGSASRRPGGKHSVQVDLAVLIVATGERKVLEVIGPQPSQVKLLPEPDIGRPPRRGAAEPARSRKVKGVRNRFFTHLQMTLRSHGRLESNITVPDTFSALLYELPRQQSLATPEVAQA